MQAVKEANEMIRRENTALKTRIKILMQEKDAKAVRCEKCQKQFLNQSFLAEHMKNRHNIVL